MKNKASGFLKQIISAITAMAKAKTLAVKSKTRAIKTRLIIFSLLRNRKFMMSSISDKLRTLVGQQDHHHHHLKKDEDDETSSEQSNAIVVHDAVSQESLPINPTDHSEFAVAVDELVELLENQEEEEVCGDKEENESKYPDLRHSLFDDLEFQDPGGSVIDLVKNSKPEGEEFRLEDEIDLVADLFIKRFHHQMKIQKQLSFKNYQEMLQRSA